MIQPYLEMNFENLSIEFGVKKQFLIEEKKYKTN